VAIVVGYRDAAAKQAMQFGENPTLSLLDSGLRRNDEQKSNGTAATAGPYD
jgi:hypothetical protein